MECQNTYINHNTYCSGCLRPSLRPPPLSNHTEVSEYWKMQRRTVQKFMFVSPDPFLCGLLILSTNQPHTQALSHRGKCLAALGDWSRLLPLHHDSCDLRRPRPIFENVIFARAHRCFLNRFRKRQKNRTERQKTSGISYIHKTNHVIPAWSPQSK